MDTVHVCDRQTDRITVTDTVQTASHGNHSQRVSVCAHGILGSNISKTAGNTDSVTLEHL